MFRPVRRILSRAPFQPPSPAMNLRLPLLSAALVSLLLSSPASAATHTNLVENFSAFPESTTWGATGNASKLLDDVVAEISLSGTDVSGWTGTGLVFKAKSCIRLGNSSIKGTVFTPPIELRPNAKQPGSATLSFHAARTASGVGVTTTPEVTVVDENGNNIAGVSPALFTPGRLLDTSKLNNLDTCYTNVYGEVISQCFTGLPNSFRFKFISSAKNEGRVAIDSVLVTQEVSDPVVISVK